MEVKDLVLTMNWNLAVLRACRDAPGGEVVSQHAGFGARFLALGIEEVSEIFGVECVVRVVKGGCG